MLSAIDKHILDRRTFFMSHPNFWANLDNQEFAVYDVHEVDPIQCAKVALAASELRHIFEKTAKVLRRTSNETLSYLGLPKNTLDFVRIAPEQTWETIIGRFDFAITSDGPKMLEFNSDTPTFIVETFSMNRAICNKLGKKSPAWNNGSAGILAMALFDAVCAATKSKGGNVVFAAFGDHKEDSGTAQYLQFLLNSFFDGMVSAKFCPIEKLTIDEEGLYDLEGEKIDVLYRLYPLEYLSQDTDENGRPIGEMFMNLVKKRKLHIINPPSAFLLQSKAIQALIWSLLETSVFDKYEKAVIRKYMLPTYLESEPLGNQKYVRKAVLGREGSSVNIIDPMSGAVIESDSDAYGNQQMVYQKYVELPKLEVMTEKGRQQFSYIHTCHLINGNVGPHGIRAGGLITNNDSYFVPIGVSDD